jgi:hypothetical protein
VDDDLHCMLCDLGGRYRPCAYTGGAHLGNQGD